MRPAPPISAAVSAILLILFIVVFSLFAAGWTNSTIKHSTPINSEYYAPANTSVKFCLIQINGFPVLRSDIGSAVGRFSRNIGFLPAEVRR
jgi:hypothetical protein